MQKLTLEKSTQENLFGLSEIMIPVTEEDLELIRQLENHGRHSRSGAFLNMLLKLRLGDNLFTYAGRGIEMFRMTYVNHTDAMEVLKKSFFNRLMTYLKDAEEKSPDTFLTVAGNIIGDNHREIIDTFSPEDYRRLNYCLRKIINLPLHYDVYNAAHKISKYFDSDDNEMLEDLALELIREISNIREYLVSVGLEKVKITEKDSTFIDFLVSQGAEAYNAFKK